MSSLDLNRKLYTPVEIGRIVAGFKSSRTFSLDLSLSSPNASLLHEVSPIYLCNRGRTCLTEESSNLTCDLMEHTFTVCRELNGSVFHMSFVAPSLLKSWKSSAQECYKKRGEANRQNLLHCSKLIRLASWIEGGQSITSGLFRHSNMSYWYNTRPLIYYRYRRPGMVRGTSKNSSARSKSSSSLFY